MKRFLLLLSHTVCLGLGFAIGIYALPILIQPLPPSVNDVQHVSDHAVYTGTFQRARKDSDLLHWGAGSLSINEEQVAFIGELAPGPDYRLFFSPTFIETEQDFIAQKHTMIEVDEVKNFDRFTMMLPEGFPINDYNTVVIWCETFGQFITSARYQ